MPLIFSLLTFNSFSIFPKYSFMWWFSDISFMLNWLELVAYFASFSWASLLFAMDSCSFILMYIPCPAFFFPEEMRLVWMEAPNSWLADIKLFLLPILRSTDFTIGALLANWRLSTAEGIVFLIEHFRLEFWKDEFNGVAVPLVATCSFGGYLLFSFSSILTSTGLKESLISMFLLLGACLFLFDC